VEIDEERDEVIEVHDERSDDVAQPVDIELT
jgi:hypothetical protein